MRNNHIKIHFRELTMDRIKRLSNNVVAIQKRVIKNYVTGIYTCVSTN